MPIRPPSARRSAAVLLLAGLLALPLLVPAKLPAGDECHLARVTYQVADLVIPVPSEVHVPSDPAPKSAAATQQDHLIKLITSTVEPKSWSQSGGRGTIDYHPLTMALVVCQAPEVQQQVADLLSALRRMQNTQVALEVRLITMDEACVERLGLDGKEGAPSKAAGDSGSPPRASFLSDAQVLRLFEAAQGDRRTNVMQAPKVTVQSGQTSVLDLTEPESFVTGIDCRVAPNGNPVITPKLEQVPVGLRLTAKPVVSADRRFVNVTLNVDLSTVGDPKADLIPVKVPVTATPNADDETPKEFTQFIQCPHITRMAVDSTVNIPDGGTVLVSGLKREREVRSEFGPPVLSEIPYLNRLFKNVGYGRAKECVLLMVTPRVIVTTDEEEKPAAKTEAAPCVQASAAAPCCKHAEAAELVAKYHRACAEGRQAEATQLAVQALAIDPACFHADGMPAPPCATSSPKER
jgi:type II secretory pathway component GspD/PulD (secretin)